jgi:tetratricopeptide (TPR) repeat protein
MSIAQGASLLEGGRYHEALGVFHQALQREPGSLATRIGLARACAGAGDRLAAIAWLSDAGRIAPADPEPVRLQADLLLGQKLYAQAVPVYERLYAGRGSPFHSLSDWRYPRCRST